ncbi:MULTISPECIES: helix-turn-helix domain-containing protein [unclassified Mesorhizobium]|uniref:GlxA family transcriptional regulator n=1 Tax=unclassified Mesorhizobium TaxID=325217 RepID=UPI000FDC0680|nr:MULTISPECIES: helix-turn-helix domain-containing protein [unclassified Mesorhizobium]TGQ45851.1 helix-turn-helix domain-containing protein [Mesorhizobium sp. M00.F.Ca.ET.216.01.1.1]TIS91012.1 MAG: helix-turn-helix domain-containing protein [Mesorhizobium sp.]TJW13008.1 MAG: helix-turn-helix domain-containing protein [Mesorhizobium sp.]TJW46804.1 MAG: helix-turn-helix domain-containing protein [Mesorhizobium sp.]
MGNRAVHAVIWLPSTFYSAVAATLVEMFDLVNTIRGAPAISFEFVARQADATTTPGISFHTRREPSRRMDLLILLAMPGMQVPELVAALEEESRHARPLISRARRERAIIAAHCGAGYFLADAGLLDRKRATISWWLKADAQRRFPKVRWDASRVLIGDGRIYTCGGGFSGLELGRALLRDLGFAKEEQLVRKLLVLPPSRQVQTPYEFPLTDLLPSQEPFRDRIEALSRTKLGALDLAFLGEQLGLTPRTLARRFSDELHTTPGRWIQDQRLEAAKTLLESTRLGIAEICYQVGYQDTASFSRLFSRAVGLPPGEYRRQSQ